MTIMKLIRCTLTPNKRTAFSKAQQAWQDMRDCDGFIAQLGGWEITADNPKADNIQSASPHLAATIVGLWQSEAHLRQFMALKHDDIFQQSQQQASYLSCKVKRFTLVDLDTCDSDAGDSINNRKDSQILHIIQFDGVAEVDPFIRALTALINTQWQTQTHQQEKTAHSPLYHGQNIAPLSIKLWQGCDDTQCLLLVSLWHSPEYFQQYSHSGADERFQSQLNTHCDSMQGSLIKLEALWNI
jgi:hypothetical protein